MISYPKINYKINLHFPDNVLYFVYEDNTSKFIVRQSESKMYAAANSSGLLHFIIRSERMKYCVQRVEIYRQDVLVDADNSEQKCKMVRVLKVNYIINIRLSQTNGAWING